MDSMDLRLGRLSNLSGADFENMTSSLPNRAKQIEENIVSLNSELMGAWQIRRERSKGLSETIENLIDITKSEDSKIDSLSANSRILRLKLEMYLRMSQQIFELDLHLFDALKIISEDIRTAFNPAIVPIAATSKDISIEPSMASPSLDFVLTLIGLLPVPYVGHITTLFASIKSGQAWKDKLEEFNYHVDRVKAIIAFEWYLDFLEQEGLPRFRLLVDRRFIELGRFDKIYDGLNESLERVRTTPLFD